MESNTPLQLKPGQRALAAIVFTDVVSFSALMQRDEVGTLRRLERDFATMRAMCAQHEGAVLKTTGDGLLLYFNSAVQAVACALALQRHFAEQKKALPDGEALTHRLGIHLGDVFIGEQDVMGDGVNIAARIQSEAEPGGICISQTVYDVVKNKLTLHVTNLGPRELKNISQSIPIYRLLLEARAPPALHLGEGRWRLRWFFAGLSEAGLAGRAAGLRGVRRVVRLPHPDRMPRRARTRAGRAARVGLSSRWRPSSRTG